MPSEAVRLFATGLALLGVQAACPAGTIQGLHDDDCYWYQYNTLSWHAAESQCASEGGHLVSLSSELVNRFLRNLSGNTSTDRYLYIGAKSDCGKRYKWSDGTLWNYTNWAKGEPKVESGCAFLRVDDGQWVTGLCSGVSSVLCRLSTKAGKPTAPPNLPTLATPPPTTPPPPCDFYWTYNPQNNLCYSANLIEFSQHVFNYNDALKLCADNGAALVSIPDLATNYFVLALALSVEGGYGESVVLGLQYNGSAWLWADGAHAKYTYWATGYPKDAKVHQVAGMQLAVYAGAPPFAQWINYDRSSSATVVCERRPNA